MKNETNAYACHFMNICIAICKWLTGKSNLINLLKKIKHENNSVCVFVSTQS